jgi:quinol monooxygenase YgiN
MNRLNDDNDDNHDNEERRMPIYTIAQYQVTPSGTEKVKRAIEEFVRYVKANEPGTRVYAAWQQKEDPARFVHFFIFEDAAALDLHSKSAAVKRFESIYRPELVGGDVTFTDYELVAANQELMPLQRQAG